MGLSRQDVEKVSLLGRLLFSEDELAHMTAQLDDIVGYVDQLSELDTSHVAPMAHAVELSNVFAADVVQPSLTAKRSWPTLPNATRSAIGSQPFWASDFAGPGCRRPVPAAAGPLVINSKE